MCKTIQIPFLYKLQINKTNKIHMVIVKVSGETLEYVLKK